MDHMDPYDLFSTPPGEIVLSSTPAKRTRNLAHETTPIRPRKNVASTPMRPLRNLTSTPIRDTNKRGPSVARGASRTPTPSKLTKNPIQKQINKKANKKLRSKKENLWEKHLKQNPELAQFVDEFNHSLEEATSKPLDMET